MVLLTESRAVMTDIYYRFLLLMQRGTQGRYLLQKLMKMFENSVNL